MRTPRLISASDPEVFWVSFQIAGTSIVSQQERTAVLRSGDMALYDSSHPYSIFSPAAFKMAVFQFPRSLLRFPDALMAELTGTRISAAEGGAAALVAPFLRALTDGVTDGTLPERRDELGDGVIDLLNAVYAARVHAEHLTANPGAAATLVRVKAFIGEQLANCDLTPGAIARANHISTRYLYKLFEDEGVGVAEWIRGQRLDRCRRDLRDPALASYPIARIALGSGFRNAQHFSRAFRAAYGLSPGAYRAGDRAKPS
jgi:AraC-like DNA-binding protein